MNWERSNLPRFDLLLRPSRQASMLAEYPTLMGVLVRILFYTNLGNANTSAQGDAVSSTSDVPPTAREGGSDGSGQQSAAERRTFLSAFEASFSKEVVSNAVSSVLLVLIQIGKQVREYGHSRCNEHEVNRFFPPPTRRPLFRTHLPAAARQQLPNLDSQTPEYVVST